MSKSTIIELDDIKVQIKTTGLNLIPIISEVKIYKNSESVPLYSFTATQMHEIAYKLADKIGEFNHSSLIIKLHEKKYFQGE